MNILEISGAIAILYYLIEAILSISRGRKNGKLNLQTHKDQLLKGHQLKIHDDINKFSNSNLTPKLPCHEFESSRDTINVKLKHFPLDNLEIEYKCLLEHIKTGYNKWDSKLYPMLKELLSQETEYKKEIASTLGEIEVQIRNIMIENYNYFPGNAWNGTPKQILNGDYKYDFPLLFNSIVNAMLDGRTIKIEVFTPFEEKWLISFNEAGTNKTIVIFPEKLNALQIFTDNINGIVSEFQPKINRLKEEQKDIMGKENTIKAKLRQITSKYKSGYRIDGKCSFCEAILKEKKIENLRFDGII